MKRYIGFLLWILAFAIPFHFALLSTEEVVHADGSANNIKGLASFVAMIALIFTGYMLVDGTYGPKAGEAHSGH